MAESSKAFSGSSDLSLWFKVRTGDPLTLADVQEIIPLRWIYIRDNWEFLKTTIQKRVPSYFDPDFLNSQIKSFSDFIFKQRNAAKNINPFSDGSVVHRFYSIFDNIYIESINLTNEEQRIVDSKTLTIKSFSKNDFLKIKKELVDYRDTITDTNGLSDDTYNAIYGKSSAPERVTASMTDANLMLNVQNNIANVDFILANLFAVDAVVDPFALARTNANNPDIDIGQYKSGNLVRMNYGENLQTLANRYLGDSNKWVDIAIANGLKPPYIDEVGEKINLISNGQKNQINIAPTDLSGNLNIDKLYINQVILMQSTVQVFPEQRTIMNIRQIPTSNEIILELDGEADLNKYKVSETASIRIYKPNTINSSFYVLIPSTQPLDNYRSEEDPWFMVKKSSDEKNAKIDLAVSETGELTFNTNGDFKLSYGIDNAIQAIKFKIITELGALRYHPQYGLINVLGTKNNNIQDIKALIVESLNNQIEADTRFDRIENIKVDYIVGQGNNGAAAIRINMSVRLAGGSTIVPISFTIAK